MKRVLAVSVISSLLTAILTVAGMEALHPPQAEAQTGAIVGTSLLLVDENGDPRVRMAPGDNGAYVLSFVDGTNARAVLGTDGSGQPRLGMLDSQGRVLVTLLANNDESASLILRDPNNARRLIAAIAPDGSAAFVALDPNEGIVGSLP